jgi:hypothetical protein
MRKRVVHENGTNPHGVPSLPSLQPPSLILSSCNPEASCSRQESVIAVFKAMSHNLIVPTQGPGGKQFGGKTRV